jgi:hypothetical protein
MINETRPRRIARRPPMARPRGIPLLAGVVLAVAAALGTSAGGEIKQIDRFLEKCPQNDPAFATITHDFTIRRNGAIVPIPACTEPVSAMPVSQYTDALILLQGLRVMYYMDRGQSGHLPWTPGSLYDWMKTKIKGFDIVGDATASGGYCCETIGGKYYMVYYPADDFNRDFDRTWNGLSDNIAFYSHEARHVDGFPHVSCCGIANGCDQTFDPANLSPYGIQWWLSDLYLTGVIDVGVGCLPEAEQLDDRSWDLSSVNTVYRDRFCTNQPAIVDPPPPLDCTPRLMIPVVAPAASKVEGREHR